MSKHQSITKLGMFGLLLLICIGQSRIGRAWGPGHADFSYTLANGFVIHKTSAHQVWLEHSSGKTPWSIPPKLTEIWWNDEFIIGKQRPLIENEASYHFPDTDVNYYWLIYVNKFARRGPMKYETLLKVLEIEGIEKERVEFKKVVDFHPRNRKEEDQGH